MALASTGAVAAACAPLLSAVVLARARARVIFDKRGCMRVS